MTDLQFSDKEGGKATSAVGMFSRDGWMDDLAEGGEKELNERTKAFVSFSFLSAAPAHHEPSKHT